MILSVDLIRLRNHLPLLQEELRKADELEKKLIVWRNRTLLNGGALPGLLQRQLYAVQHEASCIRARIKWIENTVSELSQSEKTASGKLSDALQILNNAD